MQSTRIHIRFSCYICTSYTSERRQAERTGNGNKVEAPDDAPDVADEKQNGGDELEHGDPHVDKQQTRAIDIFTLRT